MEALASEASELVWKLMSDQKLSKADLARRLGKSRAWVTQLLSGKANLTVRTLADVVHALGAEVRLRSQPSARAEGNKHAASESQPVIYKMGEQVLASPRSSETVFHLADDFSAQPGKSAQHGKSGGPGKKARRPSASADSGGGEDPVCPEYAA